MKIESIFEDTTKRKRLSWDGNPSIGWLLNNNKINLYHGITLEKLDSVFKEGIYADDSGFVLCSAEPNTALYQAQMNAVLREDRIKTLPSKDRAVCVITLPSLFLYNKQLVVENDLSNRFTDNKLYESWGKSDAEYYALIDVNVPNHIPVEFIKGYMIHGS